MKSHIPHPKPQNPTSRFRSLLDLGFGFWVLGFVVLSASAASAQAVNWPTEAPPRPLAPRAVTFPPYEIRTLSNGMQVIAVLHHEQPAVSIRLLVRAGSTHDPQGKVGVSSLAASLLNQGTTTKSAQQIADLVDNTGAAMGTGSGPDLTFINMVVMKDSFGFGMDMLADVARNPVFAAEEIDRQKQQILSGLQVNVQDPDYVASVVFDRLVYGFHPYGMPPSGTPATLASITRQDLQTYHRNYFVPNNMVLAIVGDVTSEEAFAGAERVFGRWARAEMPAVATIDPPQPTRRIIVIDKPDAVQTAVRVGQLTIPRKHADYLALDLAVKILGGEGGNRLHRVLRSERGLTYGASADTEAWKTAGHVVAETDTRTETTGEALRLMVDEFSRLQRDRVLARELSDAQAYQAGSFPITIETPNDIATQILNIVINDLPIGEIETFRERVQAITPDDIQRVARQYVRPDRLSIVLVGNASAFVPQLRAVGFTDVEVIPIGELDLMSATLRRTGRAAAPAGTPALAQLPAARRVAYVPQTGVVAPTDARAMMVLQQVVAAKGGLETLKSVRTVVADAETSFRMEQGTLASTTKTYVSYPDKFRVDANVGGQQVVQVYNAGAAWTRNPAGIQDVPAPMRDEFAASVRRDMIPLLIGASEGTLTVTLLPEQGSEGRVLRVLEISGLGVAPVRLYVDGQGFVARQNYASAGPDGRAEQAEEVFSDYRSVNGIQVPFRADLVRRGTVILSRTLTDVAINGPIDDRLFARPQ